MTWTGSVRFGGGRGSRVRQIVVLLLWSVLLVLPVLTYGFSPAGVTGILFSGLLILFLSRLRDERLAQPPNDPLESAMRDVCARYGADFAVAPPGSVAYVAGDIRSGVEPVSGRRGWGEESSAWFVWAGEDPANPSDGFAPLHIAQLCAWCPEVAPMIGLPQGWSFRLTSHAQEVTHDGALVRPLELDGGPT